MSKRTKRNSRYIKTGGDIIGTTPSQPSAFTTWFNGAKKATETAISSASSAVSSVASSAANSATSALKPSPTPPPTGGKRRRKGGTLASTASPISGILTAIPQVWVGGKSRKRRCNKHSRSCKAKKGNRKKRAKTMKFSFSNSLKRLIKL